MHGRILGALLFLAVVSLLVSLSSLAPSALLLAVLYITSAALISRLLLKFQSNLSRGGMLAALILIAVTLALLGYWTGPSAAVIFLAQFGLATLTFAVVTTLFLKRTETTALALGAVSAVFACLVATSIFQVWLIGARFSEIENLRYSVVLRVTKSGEVSGQQDTKIRFLWQNDNDIRIERDGTVAEWQQQDALIKSLSSEGFSDWQIDEMQILPTDVSDQFKVIVSLSKTKIELTRQKQGWIRELVEIHIDDRLSRSRDVEILLEIPEGFSIAHNLEGSFSESLLDNGELGQRLASKSVLSYKNDRILLSFISPSFQNPALNWLAGFSASTVFLCICSCAFGMLSFVAMVFADVLKDESAKPFAKNILMRLGLIPDKKPTEDISPSESTNDT